MAFNLHCSLLLSTLHGLHQRWPLCGQLACPAADDRTFQLSRASVAFNYLANGEHALKFSVSRERVHVRGMCLLLQRLLAIQLRFSGSIRIRLVLHLVPRLNPLGQRFGHDH